MGFRDLICYQKALLQATRVFQLTAKFPKSERFELVDQMLRSSRAVCSNIAEGYGKRSYTKHYLAKITDAEMENYEVGSWYDISINCKYIQRPEYDELVGLNEEVGKLLNYMYEHPNKFKSRSRI